MQIEKKKLEKYVNYDNYCSSLSDIDYYPAICKAASKSTLFFNHFRTSPIYNKILEHVTFELGGEYLNLIQHDYNRMISNDEWKDICRNDKYGGPVRYKYKLDNGTILKISPTTLRYVKVMLDLNKLYEMDKMNRIAEIGIGYGGQCRILCMKLPNLSYAMYDIPEVLELANRFLQSLKCKNEVLFINGKKSFTQQKYDLVISNYAFSELIRPAQDEYLKNVILQSERGYITWNSLAFKELGGYSLEELLNIIPNAHCIDENPITSEDNTIIVWGDQLG